MYIETLTFSKALLIPKSEDIFILKKDLICNNGTFKDGTVTTMPHMKQCRQIYPLSKGIRQNMVLESL